MSLGSVEEGGSGVGVCLRRPDRAPLGWLRVGQEAPAEAPSTNVGHERGTRRVGEGRAAPGPKGSRGGVARGADGERGDLSTKVPRELDRPRRRGSRLETTD